MTPQELRQRVANIASEQIGSKDNDMYWREVLPREWQGPHPEHWCGAFTLWDLHKALGCTWTWQVRGCYGATRTGYLWRLETTDTPDIGDICYMDQPYQHHAILTAVGDSAEGRPFVISVDGNSGAPPGEVDEKWRARKKWTAFYSIQPLVDAALS